MANIDSGSVYMHIVLFVALISKKATYIPSLSQCLKTRCVSSSDQNCGLFFCACISSSALQTVGCFFFDNAQSRRYAVNKEVSNFRKIPDRDMYSEEIVNMSREYS